jgi:hypothetical protein
MAWLQCYHHCTGPASCRGDTVPSCVCTYCIASLQYACSNWHHLFYTYCYCTKLKLFTKMLLGYTTISVITQIHNALNVSFWRCVFICTVQFTSVSLIVLVHRIHREIWTFVTRGWTIRSHGYFRRGKDWWWGTSWRGVNDRAVWLLGATFYYCDPVLSCTIINYHC